jgi:methylmalonyl-CoA/ethylmalonyl-CoA epimerase
MINAKGVNHIGIAVRSIANHQNYYEQVLGAEFEGVEHVPSQNVKVAFFRIGCLRLELLEPTTADSPISKFLDKRGEGLHHIAYSVDDIEARIAELQAGRVSMIDEHPRTGAHHMKVAFLHPNSTGGVLTELCEPAGRTENCDCGAEAVRCQ